MPFGSNANTWRPGPPWQVLLLPNVVLLFGLQLPEFAMLLSVSALLWHQSPAWSPRSPQYAPERTWAGLIGVQVPGSAVGRGSRYASATIKKVPTRTGPCCAPSACHPC